MKMLVTIRCEVEEDGKLEGAIHDLEERFHLDILTMEFLRECILHGAIIRQMRSGVAKIEMAEPQREKTK